jgi:hypothetical protein
MKKQLIIISGVGIILLLLAVWAYLLFFGTPKSSDELLNDLGLNNQSQNQEIVEDVASSTPDSTLNTERPKLRQLTTKPVAGFSEIDAPVTEKLPVLYYVEMGTGHIYSLNLESGEENRISATTLAGTNIASVSSKGNYVALGNKTNKTFPVNVGRINASTTEIIFKELATPVDQFQISLSGNDLLYTTKENFGLVAHSHNLKSGSDKVVFSLPFHEATIQWGNEASDNHYLYPKSTYLLDGFLYKVSNGKMSRLPVDGFGLTALTNKDIAIYSVSENAVQKNYIYNYNLNKKTEMPYTFLPEKCILAVTGTKMICAWESKKLPTEFPDSWYKGELGFRDSLWVIYGDDFSNKLLVDTFKESGREVDITDLSIGSSEKALYFINKNDNTLWMYEL